MQPARDAGVTVERPSHLAKPPIRGSSKRWGSSAGNGTLIKTRIKAYIRKSLKPAASMINHAAKSAKLSINFRLTIR